MKPQRPYLLRALYEWLIDSGDVPYVLVDASGDEVRVPLEHVKDGQIVLNLGPDAVRDLVLEQDYVMCSSRFRGQAFELYLPMSNIRAIYGRDTHEGMVFPDEDIASRQRSDDTTAAVAKQDEEDKGGKPPLRLV